MILPSQKLHRFNPLLGGLGHPIEIVRPCRREIIQPSFDNHFHDHWFGSHLIFDFYYQKIVIISKSKVVLVTAVPSRRSRLHPLKHATRSDDITMIAVHRLCWESGDEPGKRASVHPTMRFTETGMQGSSYVSNVAM
jgi:hypothetical protein